MPTDLEQLAHDIDARCRIRGSFTLRSGTTTDEYFDKYRFEGDPLLLRRIAETMVPLLPADTQILGGLELGGVPIATMLSALTGLPTIFVRKAAKTYGTCRLAEGGEFVGRTVTLIEDIVTTGGAVRHAALALRRLDATVHSVVCAIDRSEPGQNTLLGVGLTTIPILTKSELDAARARQASDGPAAPSDGVRP